MISAWPQNGSPSTIMDAAPGKKHPNYWILNLIGYGLAKFEDSLTQALGFPTKEALYRDLIGRGVASTRGTIKNRQDLFNPMVRGTGGWWQHQGRYTHRKLHLDSLFGSLTHQGYAEMLLHYLDAEFPQPGIFPRLAPPVIHSMFRQLQETGAQAEVFFLNHYRQIAPFASSTIEDARLFGDGYDFQLSDGNQYWVAEVKGIKTRQGAVRLTANEFAKAEEFRERFCLVVVSDLDSEPAMVPVFNPIDQIAFTRQVRATEQVQYLSPLLRWTARVA